MERVSSARRIQNYSQDNLKFVNIVELVVHLKKLQERPLLPVPVIRDISGVLQWARDLHKILLDIFEAYARRINDLMGFEGEITWDPASLLDGAGETSPNISIPKAELGNSVQVFPPYDLQGVLHSGYVSASGVVKIRIQNETGLTIDLASGIWKVRIIRH